MAANFIDVVSIDDLNEIFAASANEPVVLFKHSSTCGISADLYDQMQRVDGDIYLIVVQDARDVSDAIADRTGIRHQSPQAFVIRDGKAVYHGSHYGIDTGQIDAARSRS